MNAREFFRVTAGNLTRIHATRPAADRLAAALGARGLRARVTPVRLPADPLTALLGAT